MENYEPPVTLDNAVTPLQFLDALPDDHFAYPGQREMLRKILLENAREQPL